MFSSLILIGTSIQNVRLSREEGASFSGALLGRYALCLSKHFRSTMCVLLDRCLPLPRWAFPAHWEVVTCFLCGRSPLPVRTFPLDGCMWDVARSECGRGPLPVWTWPAPSMHVARFLHRRGPIPVWAWPESCVDMAIPDECFPLPVCRSPPTVWTFPAQCGRYPLPALTFPASWWVFSTRRVWAFPYEKRVPTE